MFDAGSILFNIKAAGAEVFRQELTQADQAVKGLGASQKETAKSTEEMGKRQDEAARKAKAMSVEYSAAQRSIGRSAVGMGASILAMTALTVKAAIDWESAWTGVTKTVDGTAEELQGVHDGLRDLTGVLPASHTEIAAVAEAAGQLGIETKNVVAFTKTMIDLGETTNLSANDAATALARFMNVMGTAQDKTSNLGSAVVALGNNYATTEADIVNMATRLSGAARQVGLTEGQTVGLAAALSSVGIEAEAGGSAVSKVMIDIAASVDKGGDRVQKFAKIAGVGADEFVKKWKTDPGAALALFVKGLANAEAQGQSTLGMLEELGITETRMRDALLRSAAASDQFTGAMALGNKAFDENNALTSEAEKRYDTVASKIAIAKNNVMDAAIGFGDVFLPAIVEVSQAVSDVAGFLGDLPEPLKEVIGQLGLGGGAALLFGGMLLMAIPKILEFRTAVHLLIEQSPNLREALGDTANFLKGPWGIAIAIAILGVKLLADHIESIQASAKDMDASLKGASKSADLFMTAAQGKDAKFWLQWSTEVKDQLIDLPAVLQAAADQSGNLFARFDSTHFGAFEALKDIGEALSRLAETNLPDAQEGFRMLAADTDGSEQQLWRLLSTMPAYRAALEEQALAQGLISAETSEAARKTALLELAQGTGAKRSGEAAKAYLAAADEAEGLRSTLDQLIDKINEANGVGQDAVSANIDYQQTLADVQKQIDEVRKGTEGYGAGLDIATQAGRDNKEMLNEQAQAAQEAAKAQFDLDGNTDAYYAALVDGRQRMIDNAVLLGAQREEAEKLADQIFKLPTKAEVQIIADTTEAAARLKAIKDLINGIGGTMNLHVANGRGGGGMVIDKADGGKVNFYANGGRENHIAQFARAGTVRVWAEPETEGEWYIPAAKSKRQRSTQVLAQAANEFGYQLVPVGGQSFADGGRAGAPGPVQRGGDVYNIYEATSADATAKAVARRQNALGAV